MLSFYLTFHSAKLRWTILSFNRPPVTAHFVSTDAIKHASWWIQNWPIRTALGTFGFPKLNDVFERNAPRNRSQLHRLEWLCNSYSNLWRLDSQLCLGLPPRREAFDSLTLEDLRNFAISISTMTLTYYVSCFVVFIRAQLWWTVALVQLEPIHVSRLQIGWVLWTLRYHNFTVRFFWGKWLMCRVSWAFIRLFAMSGFKNSGTCSPGYWHGWTTFVPTHNFFTWCSSFCPQRSIQASRSLLETAFSTLPPLCIFTGRLRDVTRKLKWVMGR